MVPLKSVVLLCAPGSALGPSVGARDGGCAVSCSGLVSLGGENGRRWGAYGSAYWMQKWYYRFNRFTESVLAERTESSGQTIHVVIDRNERGHELACQFVWWRRVDHCDKRCACSVAMKSRLTCSRTCACVIGDKDGRMFQRKKNTSVSPRNDTPLLQRRSCCSIG